MLEKLQFDFRPAGTMPAAGGPALAGVVSSGNLEVLLEPAQLGGACHVEVTTSAVGFGKTWQAVLQDFVERHPVGDLRVSINDAGATPAVVSLRLDQAFEEFQGSRP